MHPSNRVRASSYIVDYNAVFFAILFAFLAEPESQWQTACRGGNGCTNERARFSQLTGSGEAWAKRTPAPRFFFVVARKGLTPELAFVPLPHVAPAHTMASPTGKPATTFISKVFEVVSDSSNADVVSWDGDAPEQEEDGVSFVVWEPDRFAKEVLPRVSRSSNMCSFIRQLNAFGFHKSDAKRIAFRHPLFRPGRADLLAQIQRRKSEKRMRGGAAGASPELDAEGAGSGPVSVAGAASGGSGLHSAHGGAGMPKPEPVGVHLPPHPLVSEVLRLRRSHQALEQQLQTARASLQQLRCGFQDSLDTLVRIARTTSHPGTHAAVDEFLQRQQALMGGAAGPDATREAKACALVQVAHMLEALPVQMCTAPGLPPAAPIAPVVPTAPAAPTAPVVPVLPASSAALATPGIPIMAAHFGTAQAQLLQQQPQQQPQQHAALHQRAVQQESPGLQSQSQALLAESPAAVVAVNALRAVTGGMGGSPAQRAVTTVPSTSGAPTASAVAPLQSSTAPAATPGEWEDTVDAALMHMLMTSPRADGSLDAAGFGDELAAELDVMMMEMPSIGH